MSFLSERGRGVTFRGRSASGAVARSANSSFIQRCCVCQLIIIADERTGCPVRLLRLSRCEILMTNIKTHTTASTAQRRRLGKNNSRQGVSKQRRHKVTKPAGQLCVVTVTCNRCLLAWSTGIRRSQTAAIADWRMASSLGSAGRCRANKISRGVFMVYRSFSKTNFLSARLA